MRSDSAFEYSRTHGQRALVVARDGRVVEEAYADGFDRATPHALYSGTKSFWGMTALHAERQGLLRLDERVAETFDAWAQDERKNRVTLRHLLSLTSGIGFGGMGLAVPPYAKALAVALKNEPGRTFTYGGMPLQVFGAVLAAKLGPRGQSPHDYLQREMLDPIGMKIGKWRTLADGNRPLPTGAFVAAREWLKYGLYACERYTADAACFEGSAANPRYGLGWWLATPGAPADLFYASGAAGQAMYVIPSQRTVIVRFGESASYKHEAFLKRYFREGG